MRQLPLPRLGGLNTGPSLEAGWSRCVSCGLLHLPQAGQFDDQGGELAGELLHRLLLDQDEGSNGYSPPVHF